MPDSTPQPDARICHPGEDAAILFASTPLPGQLPSATRWNRKKGAGTVFGLRPPLVDARRTFQQEFRQFAYSLTG